MSATDSSSTLKDALFIGTHGYVVCVDKWKGHEYWRTSLPGTGYALVTLLFEEGVLYAASAGRLFALDPLSGEMLWENGLKGLGYGFVGLATVKRSLSYHENPTAQAAASASKSSSSTATTTT